jgi:hypothetical protein
MLREPASAGSIKTSGRKAEVVPLVNQGIRDYIVRQVGIWGKTCWQVANSLDGEWNAAKVEQVLFQEMTKKVDLAYRQGYRDGKFSLFPPPTVARRAA